MQLTEEQAWVRTSALWPGIAPGAERRFAALAQAFVLRDTTSWVPEQGALAVLIADWWTAPAHPSDVAGGTRAGRVLGISGAQGTGKSTFAAHLAIALENLQQRVAVLSLDDLYLSHAARQRLAVDVHPLLATRGVPGTHDVEFGHRLLTELARSGDGGAERDVALPRFDKSLDDPAPVALWPHALAPCDTVLLEGWCLGITPEDTAALRVPCNALEANEDAQGRWRTYVNTQLAARYAAFFARCARFVVLLPPDFAAVRRWRGWQEQALPGSRRMADAGLDRFIAHYERLTRHGLTVLPGLADVVVRLASDHRIAAIDVRRA